MDYVSQTDKADDEDFYCKYIIPNKLPHAVFQETQRSIAYQHTDPFWSTHYVVIPKKHIPSFIDIDPSTHYEDMTDLLELTRVVASYVNDKCGGARILTNVGEYQDSKHLHFHVYHGKELKG